NIAIRKEMHDENPYGKTKVDFEWKKIIDGIGNRHLLIDENIRLQVEDAFALNDGNIGNTIKYLKQNPVTDNFGRKVLEACFKIDKVENQVAYTIRKNITEITDLKRLKKIASLDLQKQLLEHLDKY